jgi:micrococcal nuclease
MKRLATIALLTLGVCGVAAVSAPGGRAPPGRARFRICVGARACATARDPTAAREFATVERVVDGDTFVARTAEMTVRVRLIGIDTPETVKPNTPVRCFGPEASARARSLLPPGERVELAYDVRRLDRYGRTLAYVYRARDDLFVNLDLVARGYARTLDIAPDHGHASEFARAERAARARRIGLWDRCVS